MNKKLTLIAFFLCTIFLNAQTITEFSTGYTSLEGVAVDSNNNVFVSEFDTGNIFQIDASGNQTLYATTGFRANDIVFDASDNLYVAEPFNDKILIVDTSGNVSDYLSIFGSNPFGLDFDNDLLYFASENQGKIVRINSNLTTTDYSTGFFSPEGIAFDSNGNLFVADRNDRRLFKVTPSGTVTTLASAIENIRGVAVSPNDDVYFTQYTSSQNTILKYEAATGNLSVFVETQLDQPRCISIDNAGNMYVTNRGNGTVIKINDPSLALSLSSFSESKFKISPNPASNLLNIEGDIDFEKLSIYDLNGKKLLESTDASINIESLSNGIYLIEMKKDNNIIVTERFIKE